MTIRSFTFEAHCPDHPLAGLNVTAIDAPDTRIPCVSRVHTACAECGDRWTWTVTCVPTKPHLREVHDARRVA